MTRPASHLSERPPDDDVRSWADLRAPPRSVRSSLGCFLLTLALYLAFLPRFLRFCSPPTGDQAFYLMTTASIAQDLDLELRNNYENRDEDEFYSLCSCRSSPFPSCCRPRSWRHTTDSCSERCSLRPASRSWGRRLSSTGGTGRWRSRATESRSPGRIPRT